MNKNNGNPAQSQYFQDLDTLYSFMMRKASEYFNEAARKAPTPDIAAKDDAVADMLGKYAVLTSHSPGSWTPKDVALFLKAETWLENTELFGTREKIEDYTASKIGEFITAQPDVWHRLESRTDNKFIAKMSKYLKP